MNAGNAAKGGDSLLQRNEVSSHLTTAGLHRAQLLHTQATAGIN